MAGDDNNDDEYNEMKKEKSDVYSFVMIVFEIIQKA